MTSLLLLPKLIYRIRVFIPCWTRDEEEWDRDFCPKNLVTACKVSWFWHATLSPLLWEVYDQGEMNAYPTPPKTLQAQGQYSNM